MYQFLTSYMIANKNHFVTLPQNFEDKELQNTDPKPKSFS